MMDDLPALPPLLSFASHPFAEPEEGARVEWFEGDGMGGGAAGSLISANTRADHGLLIVRQSAEDEPLLLLAHVDDAVILAGGERFELGCNFYPGAVHPDGNTRIEAFSLDPWPVWRFAVGETRVVRELFQSRRAGALIVRYRIEAGEAQLEVRPMFAGRPLSRVRAADEPVRMDADASEGLVAWQPSEELPAALVSYGNGEWSPHPLWFYRTRYPEEPAGSGRDREDLASPGVLRLPLSAERPAAFACGLRPVRIGRARRWSSNELERREQLAARAHEIAPADARLGAFAARLTLAADAFVRWNEVEAPLATGTPARGLDVREALQSLPLLAVLYRRTDVARGFLRRLADRLRDGLLPDRLPVRPADRGAWAAADVPLLFIEAAAALADAGENCRPLIAAMDEIVDAFERGTGNGIALDAEGLLRHGTPAHGGTWLDGGGGAAVRPGRAVEISALWYNATMRLAAVHPDITRRTHLTELADRCRNGFSLFWSEALGHLVDRLDPDGRADPALRPSQLFAVSLPAPVLHGERARRATDAVERLLLTPAGLRTLASSGSGYDGSAEMANADGSWHRGAIIPGLIGTFVRAHLRVHAGDAAARRRARELILRMEDRLRMGVAGHIAARAAGDAPHAPAGERASLRSLGGVLEGIAAIGRAERGLPV